MVGAEVLTGETASVKKTSWLVRLIVWAGFFIVFCLISGILALAAFCWYIRSEHFGAVKRTADLVSEIRAAGEPATVAELQVFHRVPPDSQDATAAWTRAMATFDAEELRARVKELMSAAPAKGPPPPLDESQIATAKELLSQYQPTLEAVSLAAATKGECRLPFDSKDYLDSSGENSLSIQSLGHLLALEARIHVTKRDADSAIASLTSLYALAEAMKNQPSMTEQAARLSVLRRGFEETSVLLSDCQLTRGQLQALAARAEECDLTRNLTVGLVGDRAMMYEFYLSSKPPGIAEVGRGPIKDPEPGMARDCECYLVYATKLVEASQLPFPIALDMAETFGANLKQEAKTWGPIKRRQITYAPQDIETHVWGFAAQARILALREAVRTLIAAKLYELDNGAFPSSLEQLIPDYLPAIPVDPFDGDAIRAKFEAGEIVVYSVGPDRIDDRGRPEIDSSGDIALGLKAAQRCR